MIRGKYDQRIVQHASLSQHIQCFTYLIVDQPNHRLCRTALTIQTLLVLIRNNLSFRQDKIVLPLKRKHIQIPLRCVIRLVRSAEGHHHVERQLRWMRAKLLACHTAGNHVNIILLIERPRQRLIIVVVRYIAVFAAALREKVSYLLEHALLRQIITVEAVVGNHLLLACGLPDEIITVRLLVRFSCHRIHAAASRRRPRIGLIIMELADAVGLVACILQGLHKCRYLREQITCHGQRANLARISSRDKRGTRRRTDRIGCIAASKMGMLCNPVDIRRGNAAVRGIAHIICALLISHKQQNITRHILHSFSEISPHTVFPLIPKRYQGERREIE